MIKNIRHAALVVSDLQRSRNFYEIFLGFTLLKEDVEEGPFIENIVGLPNVRLHWVKLKASNGILIELLKYISPESPGLTLERKNQPSNQLGHSHLAFTVESMAIFISEFKKINGSIVNEPALNPEKTAIVCYIHDPEGNILEIVEEV